MSVSVAGTSRLPALLDAVAVAARHGRSLAQLGIAWVLSNPAVTVALVGMRNNKFQRVLKDFDGKGLTRPRRLQQE